MIIKKFQASTETEAMMMAKEEMGSSAVIMNIKTIKQRGLARFFKNDIVEVTAALEERLNTDKIPTKTIDLVAKEQIMPELENPKTNAIEEKLNNLQNMLESKINSNEKELEEKFEKKNDSDEENSVNLKFIQLVYR
ncbi:MAG: flagellar biosynthesis protein FlhF, partial [Lachnospiraceae bacterium]|nr:flagellar biosynthesis protein FlhF [Lachnospiraceae bacterium]